MKIMNTLLICYALAGCTAMDDKGKWLDALRRENDRVEAMVKQPTKAVEADEPGENKCPPIPKIADDATRFEARVFTLTLIALYEQCAKSKK